MILRKSTLLTLALAGFFLSASAQLNGTFTIGGTSPDYATLQAAATAAQAQGLNGPVIFNIRPGTYSGKVSMGQIPGVSSTNTVTFQSESGDSTSVVISDSSSTSASSNFTVLINGTDHVIFRQLTIERIGNATYGTVVYIGSGSRFVAFQNCILRTGTYSTTTINACVIYTPLSTSQDTGATFVNNQIEGGSYGMYLIGQAGNLIPQAAITGNTFLNQYYRGINLSYSNAPSIEGNNITTNSTYSGYNGVLLDNSSGAGRVLKNRISCSGTGIALSNCINTAGNDVLLANNFVSCTGTGNAYGISVTTSSYVQIYYNSINLTATGTFSAACNISGSGSSNLDVQNNIFVNTGGGNAFSVESAAVTAFSASDYNDLYVAPADTVLGSWGGTDAANLTAWQAASAMDANSVSSDPQFTSSTDLHAGNPGVNDAGTPLSGVTDDIDGDARSLTTPDIGADEFTPLNDNIGLISFLYPDMNTCGDSAVAVAVILRNFGQNAQWGFDITAEASGAVSGSITETYSDTLASNAADTLFFSQTINTYGGGTVDFTAYSQLSGDQYPANDTIRTSFDYYIHPNPPTAVSPQQQCDNNLQVTATADSGDVVFWYDAPTGGNLLHIGTPFNTPVTSDTTFYAESHQGSGASGCLRIVEIEPGGVNDYIEIENLSGVGFDATGWKVVISDSYTDVNLVNAITWDLGYFNAGEIQYKTDGTSDNYWGNNIFWNPGSSSWAMIIDDQGNIVDFVAWDWDAATLQSLNITVAGFTITLGTAWTGDGVTSCTTTDNMQRIGSEDHDDLSDWICQVPSKGVQNTGLDNVFSNCGIGACGSVRVPVDVTLISGVSTSLGPDTALVAPFTYTLDAGTGFTAYAWSTGDTTQTLDVTAPGTYWVTVTGSNGCTFTDSVNITIDVAVAGLDLRDVEVYPSPASDKVMISGATALKDMLYLRLTDIRGREMDGTQAKGTGANVYTMDVSRIPDGIYFLQVVTPRGTGTVKIGVAH